MICEAVSRSHLGNEIQRETLAPYSQYVDLIFIPNTNDPSRTKEKRGRHRAEEKKGKTSRRERSGRREKGMVNNVGTDPCVCPIKIVIRPLRQISCSHQISIENMICDAVSRSHLGNEIQRETLAPYSQYVDLILIF